MKKYLIPLLSLFSLATATMASAQTISLGEQDQLAIVSRDRLTTIALVHQGQLSEAMNIGNSLFEKGGIRLERFCKGCDKAYLIPVADAASTYGATTYILAYPYGSNWVLAKLPMNRVELVKARSNSDYYLLEALGQRYTFEQGMLRPTK